MKILRESLKNAPIVMRGNYPYFIHPLTDGIPQIEPALLKDAVNEVIKRIDVDSFNKILTIEAMGLPVGVSLSLALEKPLVVVRKKPYGLEGEVMVTQKTGYSAGKLYINSVKKDDRLLIVDDVLSTGGTIIAVVEGLRQIGASISDIVVVVNKNRNIKDIEKRIGIKIKSIVNIDIRDGRVVILDDV